MQNISDWRFSPRREERQVRINNFLAAFASLCSGHALREIFRIFGCGFAAPGFFWYWLCVMSPWFIRFAPGAQILKHSNTKILNQLTE